MLMTRNQPFFFLLIIIQVILPSEVCLEMILNFGDFLFVPGSNPEPHHLEENMHAVPLNHCGRQQAGMISKISNNNNNYTVLPPPYETHQRRTLTVIRPNNFSPIFFVHYITLLFNPPFIRPPRYKT